MQTPYDRRVSDPLPVHVRLCAAGATHASADRVPAQVQAQQLAMPPRPMAQGEEIYFPQVLPHSSRPQEAHPDPAAAHTHQGAPHDVHGHEQRQQQQQQQQAQTHAPPPPSLTLSQTGLPTSGLGSIGPAEELQMRQLRYERPQLRTHLDAHSEDFFKVDSPLPFHSGHPQ